MRKRMIAKAAALSMTALLISENILPAMAAELSLPFFAESISGSMYQTTAGGTTESYLYNASEACSDGETREEEFQGTTEVFSGSETETLSGSNTEILSGSNTKILSDGGTETLSGGDTETPSGSDTEILSGSNTESLSCNETEILSGSDTDRPSCSDTGMLSEGTQESVSGYGTVTDDALQAFDKMQQERAIAGVIFHDDAAVFEVTDDNILGPVLLLPQSGDEIIIQSPFIDRSGVLCYQVSCSGISGAVDRYHIATNDERLELWEDAYLPRDIGVVIVAADTDYMDISMSDAHIKGNGSAEDPVSGYGENGSIDDGSDRGEGSTVDSYDQGEGSTVADDSRYRDACTGADDSRYRDACTGADDGLTCAYTLSSLKNDNGIVDFPDGLKSRLSALSEAHPQWKFVRKDVSADWDEAVANEMTGSRSWIEGSADSEYVDKSSPMGGSWYLASKDGVAHYMDPSSYFDDTHIFAFETQAYNASYQTEDAVAKLLASTFMSGKLEDDSSMTYAEAFTRIGSLTTVNSNPLFLAARVKQEQGSGTGSMISGKYSGYEGYYNYFNIKATGTGDTAVKNGLAYAKEQGWNTRYKSLRGGAEYTGSRYIQKGQDTLYFQKFNIVNRPYYSNQYMQNIRAPYFEAATLAKGYKNAGIMERGFVFIIPVLNNMPDMGEDDNKNNNEEEKDNEETGKNNINKITLNKTSLNLKTGQKYRLIPSLQPVNTQSNLSDIKYNSSDDNIVSIGKDGYITAIQKTDKPVTVEVVANNNDQNVKAECIISVTDCLLNVYDENGANVCLLTASYGDKISDVFYLSRKEFISGPTEISTSGNLVSKAFAGWFTKPDGTGERLWWDSRITGDIEIYPIYRDVSSRSLTILPVGDQVFTGEPLRPPVEVYYKGTRLREKLDYKLSFKSNKNVGKATVVVNWKKSFGESVLISFNIVAAEADYELTGAGDAYAVYKGKEIYAKPVITFYGKRMKKGRDYELTYTQGNLSGAYAGPGIYPVKVSFTGNITGELYCLEIIAADKAGVVKNAPASIKGGGIAQVTGMKYEPDGPAQYYRPYNLAVSDKNGKKLVQGTDYVVTYKNDTAPGTAVLTVRGIGGYTGTIKKKYSII